ncbi:MAG TPA: Zn-dependent hydrolase, partial [Terriglobales bacterium]|nr:Zn-dependent hydrolase [Terriglobales bacterium]
DALPLAPEDRPSKKGHLTPMEVMDSPYRGGDMRHGYQAVADNLPNDPRIHAEKGTKKLFFKNFMDARVNYVILPIARVLMPPEQAAKASGDGYMAGTIMHEICHGLGPTYSRVNGKQVDIREAIGPVFGGLEEAKADVVGMWALKWLVDKGVLPKERLQEYYTSYLAGNFRTLRFGTGESHGKAEMMEFNWHYERGGFKRDDQGRYSVDFDKIGDSIAALAKELLEIEATGDRARAEALLNKYDTMPEHLTNALKKVEHVPVDVDPKFSFPDKIE